MPTSSGSPPDQALWRGVARLHGQSVKVRITQRPEAVAGPTDIELKDVNDLWRHDPALAAELLQVTVERPPKLHDSSLNAVLDEASRMSTTAFEHGREQIGRLINYRVTRLEKSRTAFIAARRAAESDDSGDRWVEPEPWEDAITNISAVLDEIVTEIKRYVAASPEVYDTVALWCAFSHLIHHDLLSVNVAPRLAIQSATTICGKTTLLECIDCLVPRPRMSGSISPAAVFRIVEASRPTLLLDEVDNLIHVEGGRELLGILNSGHRRRSAFVERVEKTKTGQFVVTRFSTFTGIVLVSISALPETQQNRSVAVTLYRAVLNEVPEHLQGGESPVLLDLRRKLIRWALDLVELPAAPARPPELLNRKGDNWSWLLSIAAEAGGDWPARAMAAALGNDDDPADQNVVTALLASLWEIFADRGAVRLSTPELVSELHQRDEGRWMEANAGKPVSDNFLGKHLKKVIHYTKELRDARQWKAGGRNVRGYAVVHFEDAWRRYLGRDKPTHTRAISNASAAPGTAGSPGMHTKSDEKSNGSAVPGTSAKSDVAGTPGAHDFEQDEEKQGLRGKVPGVPGVPEEGDSQENTVLPLGARARRKSSPKPDRKAEP